MKTKSACGSKRTGQLVSKTDRYRTLLASLEDWDYFLLKESGLPGPRANIELAQVVADMGKLPLFARFLTFNVEVAPVGSPYEFLPFCGILGLGRLISEGEHEHLGTLRLFASDPRWRIREAVAMALQRLGDTDMKRLIVEMHIWARGTPLAQRAAAASLCEPRLLVQAEHAREVLEILTQITASLMDAKDRENENFQTLRKGLGYCWSVAVVSLPVEGKKYMERWMLNPDKDIRWIMKENLKKARLTKMDADWVRSWQSALNR